MIDQLRLELMNFLHILNERQCSAIAHHNVVIVVADQSLLKLFLVEVRKIHCDLLPELTTPLLLVNLDIVLILIGVEDFDDCSAIEVLDEPPELEDSGLCSFRLLGEVLFDDFDFVCDESYVGFLVLWQFEI